MPSGGVECSATGHQPQRRGQGRVVDLVGREPVLGVLLDPVDGEPGRRAVGAADPDLVAPAQLAEPVEDRRAALGVDVAEDDRRPRIAGRGPGAYQPATSQSLGTSTVPSGARPSRSRELVTWILGM